MTPDPSLGQIGQIAMTIEDVERAVEFYRDKLGLKLLFTAPPAMAFFACDGIRLMLSKPESPDGERYRGIIYFKVPDIHATRDALFERGIQFEQQPRFVAKMADHELWMAFFRDPDRNLLALMCEKR